LTQVIRQAASSPLNLKLNVCALKKIIIIK